jgi:hypothetical protein
MTVWLVDVPQIPTSAGCRSLDMCRKSTIIFENIMTRDKFNTRPGVFTGISKHLTSAPGSNSKPWFQAVNSQMIPGPQPVQDYNTLVGEWCCPRCKA